MKIALLGNGKTGGKVEEILRGRNAHCTVFNIDTPPTLEKLKGHDVIISFLPGEIFKEYLNLLVSCRIPVVNGSTGLSWPSDIDQRLKKNKTKWITASNFALGMNLIHNMIQVLSKARRLFNEFNFSIKEIHHIHKKDAPSGTALAWERWLGHKARIESERIGDVTGEHTLSFETSNEKITLKHEALDRKIFATGALWAADKILNDSRLSYGLHYFEDITREELL